MKRYNPFAFANIADMVPDPLGKWVEYETALKQIPAQDSQEAFRAFLARRGVAKFHSLYGAVAHEIEELEKAVEPITEAYMGGRLEVEKIAIPVLKAAYANGHSCDLGEKCPGCMAGYALEAITGRPWTQDECGLASAALGFNDDSTTLVERIEELKEAHGAAIIAQSEAVDRAETAEAQFRIMLNAQGSTARKLEASEKLLHQTQKELNAANKAANEAESKVSLYATAARVIALHLKEFCDESLPYDQMIADAARKAGDKLQKAKEWNALCELELNNLRSIAEDQDQELSALRIMLLELCEKMEAGISGPEETKRARVLLDAIKANQEKK